MTKVVTFIGFGEAGSLIAQGLLAHNEITVRTYDRLLDIQDQRDTMTQRARKIGVTVATGLQEAVAGADLVFSTVTADQCVAAATAAAPALNQCQVWLDLNSTSPMAKMDASTIINNTGADYVDVAVMENVPVKGHRVPLLLAGPGAVDATRMLNALNMDATRIGDRIGQAATIKMCRSVFLKGFDAILLECLTAAELAGVQDAVLNSIHASFPALDLPGKALGRVKRVSQHSARRASEMREVSKTLEYLQLSPITATATAEILERLAASGAAQSAQNEDFELSRLGSLMQS